MHTNQADNESLFKHMFANVPTGIAVVTEDGHWIQVNSSWCELLGYSMEELMLLDLKDLLFIDDWNAQVEKLQNGETLSQPTERRYLHKNGSVVWLSIQLSILNKESHQGVPYYIIYIIDISKTKEVEEHLLETEIFLQLVSQNTQEHRIIMEAQRIALIGSWEWDIDHKRMLFSEQLVDVYLCQAKEVIRQSIDILDLVQEPERQQFKETIAEMLREGSELCFESQNIVVDGGLQYLYIRGIAIRDEDGRPIRMNGTVQDITDQKKAELKLQETVERYTSLKKYNHDAVISLDLNGMIINSNVKAEELTGYYINEMVGMYISNLIGNEQMHYMLAYSLNDVTIENKINGIIHRHGHRVDVLTTIAPIIINGDNVGFYILIKDMTEHKRILIEKETAESMNKAKSEFLTMMSHEIRTPMNGIMGMAELLLETTELDAQQKGYLEIMHKSSDSLLGIINDILDFSKIESGKIILQENPLDVKDCIADTLGLLSAIAEKKGLQMNSFINPNVPVCIGDSERLKQVLINIIGNAVKFTFSGDIYVTVERISRLGHGVELKFVIKDTGIGIPQDKVERLFEPFSQVDHILTDKYEGSGLGLSISKRLVELMGGKLGIEECTGAGTTFVFTILLKEYHDSMGIINNQSPEDEHSKEHFPLKILIAEDNEINQIVLKKMLEKQGHNTTIVSDGYEVIQALAYERYDLIFMDIQMPEMNGYEVTAIIKEMIPEELCPIIIAVTANALKGDREKCLAVGMDNYISKPIKIKDLKKMIENYY